MLEVALSALSTRPPRQTTVWRWGSTRAACWPQLSSITAPASIVHGDDNPIYPFIQDEALTAAIPPTCFTRDQRHPPNPGPVPNPT